MSHSLSLSLCLVVAAVTWNFQYFCNVWLLPFIITVCQPEIIMSNTMTAHEPINYLDSILNEEEKRCEYSHQWRNFTISRSGRFKSKNKHRNVVDGKMFDRSTGSSSSTSSSSPSINNSSQQSSASAGASMTSSFDKDKKVS